jgi:hypothetical protein
MGFDHAHRALYSAILGHKLIVTQSAYACIPDLFAAAGGAQAVVADFCLDARLESTDIIEQSG